MRGFAQQQPWEWETSSWIFKLTSASVISDELGWESFILYIRTHPTKYNFLVEASVGQKISWCFRVTHLWTKIRCFLGLCCFKRKCPKRSEKKRHPAIPPKKNTQKANGMLLQDMIRKVTFSNFVDVHEISWQLEPSEAPWWKHHVTPTFRPHNSSLNGNYLQVEKIGAEASKVVYTSEIFHSMVSLFRNMSSRVFFGDSDVGFMISMVVVTGDVVTFHINSLDGCFGIHPFEPRVLPVSDAAWKLRGNPFRSFNGPQMIMPWVQFWCTISTIRYFRISEVTN